MELLRKISEFTTSIEDKREIYTSYIRSIVEQSSVVWHSSLTKENSQDLERVQKCAVRLILGGKYESYEDALTRVNLDSLYTRREQLCKNFALKSIKSDNERANGLFKEKDSKHKMKARNYEKYEVKFANTGRLKKSAVPYMQRMLNNVNTENVKKGIKRKISEYENKHEIKRRKPG